MLSVLFALREAMVAWGGDGRGCLPRPPITSLPERVAAALPLLGTGHRCVRPDTVRAFHCTKKLNAPLVVLSGLSGQSRPRNRAARRGAISSLTIGPVKWPNKSQTDSIRMYIFYVG